MRERRLSRKLPRCCARFTLPLTCSPIVAVFCLGSALVLLSCLSSAATYRESHYIKTSLDTLTDEWNEGKEALDKDIHAGYQKTVLQLVAGRLPVFPSMTHAAPSGITYARHNSSTQHMACGGFGCVSLCCVRIYQGGSCDSVIPLTGLSCNTAQE